MSNFESWMRDLGWSLWTELGVSGTLRAHKDWAIDPEALLLVSPFLFGADARLMDQVYGWCSEQSAWISASRVRALWKASDEDVQKAFLPLAANLRAHEGLNWVKSAVEPQRRPSFSPTHLRLERPALLAMRLRALCGVGARADVLLALLTHPGWRRASQLAHLGYAKRRVAEILDTLSQAGLTEKRHAGNALEFRLRDRSALSALCRAQELHLQPWAPYLNRLVIGKRLSGLDGKPEGVRRVAAHRATQELRQQYALSDRSEVLLVAESEDPVQAALRWLQET